MRIIQAVKRILNVSILIVILSFVYKAQSCQPTVNPRKDFDIHSCVSRRETNETDAINGVCNHNTRENSICLPDFKEWQTIHAAWHRPVIDAQLGKSIICYLDKHSHSRERCDKSPTTCDWCRVGGHVRDYLKQLMKKVEEICSLFAIKELINTGSSAEKTNIFQASEFDHLAILENFRQSPSDPYEIVYTGSDQNYKNLKDNSPINVRKLLNLFQKSISEAVQLIPSDHLSAPTIVLGKTGVTSYFFYSDGSDDASRTKISIDIAIGVHVQQQPAIRDYSMSNKDVVLVPQRPGTGSQWRLSYPTLERNMLLKSDASVTRVYQLLKFLAALHHSKDNLRRNIPRKSSLTTYVLKTCLFRYMRYYYRPENPWASEDVFHHALGVLDQFPLNSTEITSFFNSDIVEFNITEESKKAAAEIISKLEQLI